MRKLLVPLVLLLAPLLARADDATGAWEGEVALPGVKLGVKIVFDTPTSGTIDIPAQGVTAALLTDVHAGAADVTFTLKVPGAPAIFAGKRAGDAISGTLAQGGQSFPFTLTRKGAAPTREPLPPPAPAKEAQALIGTWGGKVGTGPKAFDAVLDLAVAGDALGGTLAVPRQCVRAEKVAVVGHAPDGRFRVVVQASFGLVTFDVTPSGDALKGEYTQSGNRAPFTLRRVKEKLPYDEEEVTIPSGDVKLAATLSRPHNLAKAPAVVLLTGSGPQNRDECVVGVRPFAAIADALARAGVAVLRADDRGAGASTGDFGKATAVDFAADAAAELAYLRGRPDIDPDRIGLLGHSEGAYIATMVAAKDAKVAYVVLLAGAGLGLVETIVEQQELIDRADGESEKNIAAETAMTREIFDLLRARPSGDLKPELEALAKKHLPPEAIAKAGGLETLVAGETRLFDTPWLRFYLDYDPLATLAKVACPVLAVSGALDLQVPPKKNLAAIKETAAKAGNREAKTVLLPGLNHLFQRAKTGSPAEYAKLPPTLDASLFKAVVPWVVARVKR